jgi:Ni,Fe-hydrogenase III component G
MMMKVETKDQLRAEVQKLKGQVVDLKKLARDQFTVTMSKDQFTFLMDKLWHAQVDMSGIVQIAEEDDCFDGHPNQVLLQAWGEVRSLYNDLKDQTDTQWEFNVGTQKLYMSYEGSNDG